MFSTFIGCDVKCIVVQHAAESFRWTVEYCQPTSQVQGGTGFSGGWHGGWSDGLWRISWSTFYNMFGKELVQHGATTAHLTEQGRRHTLFGHHGFVQYTASLRDCLASHLITSCY